MGLGAKRCSSGTVQSPAIPQGEVLDDGNKQAHHPAESCEQDCGLDDFRDDRHGEAGLEMRQTEEDNPLENQKEPPVVVRKLEVASSALIMPSLKRRTLLISAGHRLPELPQE